MARDQLPRTDTRWTQPARTETEAGAAEGRRRAAPGESAPVRLPAAWAAQAWESTKHRPNWVCAFVEYLKTGTARNAWPASYRASWSLNSVDGERTHPWEGANPVWPEHCECSPHRPMKFVFSAPSSPQHDWTSESKQETTSSRLCQGRN